MSNVDVELVYGVAGGGEISGASGQEITKSLQGIVKGLERQKIPQIKIFFDENDLNTKLKKIKESIQKLLSEAGKLDVKVTARGLGTATQNNSSNQIKEQTKVYNDYTKQIKEFYKLDAANAKTRYKDLTVQKQKTEELSAAQKAFNATIADMKNSPEITAEQKESLTALDDSLANNNALIKQNELQNAINSYDKYVKKVGQFIEQMKNQGLATDEARKKLQELEELMQKPLDLKDLDTEKALTKVKEMTSELQAADLQTASELYKSGAAHPTVLEKFFKAFKNKFQSMLSATLIATMSRALMQVYRNVVSIDTAMTQLKIVTNSSTKAYEEFGNKAIAAAKKLGVAISDLIESTTTYARLGFSLTDSETFAELTAMYSNVTGVDVDTATTNITAVVKAYNIAADDLESVLDKMIAVGNNFAISSGELGTAMNNAASILASSGNSLEEAMGILAAANATLQNVSKSSTAVRTIIARLTASTAELQELGEDTTDIKATADLAETMEAYGVRILDANGDLRSTYDILNDIAEKWDDLNSVEQAAIANLLAGTRQQTAFYSIIENWEDAKGAVEDANNAEGTLEESYETYLDSIEGKLGQLQAAWQSVSESILNSEVVKVLIDIIKTIANVVDAVLNFGNGVMKNALIVTAVLALITTAVSAFKTKIITAMTQIGTSVKKVFTSSYTWIGLIMTILLTMVNKAPKWATIIVSAISLVGSIFVLVINIIDKKIKQFKASTIIGLISLAITGLITCIKSLVELTKGESYDDIKDAAKEAAEAWEDAKDELEEVTNQLDEIQEKIDEINGKETLTLVDKEQLAALKQQYAILEAEAEVAEKAVTNAEKTAVSKAIKVIDENSYVKSLADAVSKSDNKILQSWFNATDLYSNYLQEVKEAIGSLEYYTEDNLEGWQTNFNSRLDDYYDTLEKYLLLTGDVSTAWDTIFSRLKYSDAIEKITESAKKFNLDTEELQKLYTDNTDIQEFIYHLQDLGLVTWGDTESMSALVAQFWSLRNASTIASKGVLDFYDTYADRYDALKDAMDDMSDLGIISGDTFNSLIEALPEWWNNIDEAGFELTNDGYVLKDDALTTWLESIKAKYEDIRDEAKKTYEDISNAKDNGFASQEEVDNAYKNWQTAIENYKNLLVTLNTLQREDLLDEYKERLEEISDNLDEQLDKYKDIIDIRKDLLESYQEEIDYQKTLAQKQKSVADLQTQLSLARLDTSAAGQARVRELEDELSTAQEELDEYTLEHAIEQLTDELDEQYNEYETFINNKIQEIEDAIDSAANLSSEKITDALANLQSGETITTHHTGGFVGGTTEIQSNEEFAKLLKGELVVTPNQMSNFMDNTLPKLTNSVGGVINYNSPLVSIQCDSITKDSIPQLEKIVDKAVKEVKIQINSSLKRSGLSTAVDKFQV